MEITLRTLTPLWTGGVDQKCDRLHETGLVGSLRWWYEALVRGLGGSACDPTSEDRCPDRAGKRCAACELFGCTGWARKFRLRVLDEEGRVLQEAVGAGVALTLQLLELRPVTDEERWLLGKAVCIAAQRGALGGKTTLKPQTGIIGQDYGVLQWVGSDYIPESGRKKAETYLQTGRWRTAQTTLPDLRCFFFIRGAFLWRAQMNPLLGLDPNGDRLPNLNETQRFLQGRRGGRSAPAVSKKLFSFRADGGRIWGYAQNAKMRDDIIDRINKILGDGSCAVKTGEEVLNEL